MLPDEQPKLRTTYNCRTCCRRSSQRSHRENHSTCCQRSNHEIALHYRNACCREDSPYSRRIVTELAAGKAAKKPHRIAAVLVAEDNQKSRCLTHSTCRLRRPGRTTTYSPPLLQQPRSRSTCPRVRAHTPRPKVHALIARCTRLVTGRAAHTLTIHVWRVA